MTSLPTERLYNLLPAIYRIRDGENGQPLRGLLALLEEELRAVEDDVAQLYEDAFIETCAEWVVPYIGDLLAVRRLHDVGRIGQRAYVANTIAYRRRKGTVAVLEQLARDVTGWPARAVEFFEHLTATQHLNHLRSHCLVTPDLRHAGDLELLDGPFEQAMHSGEVRRIPPGRGRYNIPNIGLFLWRLQSYAVTLGTARAVAGAPDGCYWFSPLGYDSPLFNPGRSESEITTLADEMDVPGILRRLPLYDELEQRRQALADDLSDQKILDQSSYFGLQPVLGVKIKTEKTELEDSAELLICDLSDWHLPPTTKPYTPTQGGAVQNRPIVAAVDPLLGRLALATAAPAGAHIQVSYCYGFSADVGGGPYDRRDNQEWWYERHQPVTWQIGVTRDPQTLDAAPDPTQLRQNLGDALNAWNLHITDPANAGAHGLIVVMDSASYREELTGANAMSVPPGSRLAIVAGDWPLEADPTLAGALRRSNGSIVLSNRRPHIRGTVEIRAASPVADVDRGELVLDGLLIEGQVTVAPGDLGILKLAHCTLVPALGGLRIDAGATEKLQHQRLRINLLRCISGPVVLPADVPELRIAESIIDHAGAGAAIIATGASLDVEASTVLGAVEARSMDASNSIFAGDITVERHQIGCLRFSFVTGDSRTGRRYRCQPDLALARRAKELGIDPVAGLPSDERDAIRARVRPVFASRRYGQPAYAQLSLVCPEEITTGAQDGSEMGVFTILKNSLREANLRAVLDEYLRFGYEAGISYVT